MELTVKEAPRWEYIAARLALLRFEERLADELEKRHIASFPEKIEYLVGAGLYGDYILKAYSREDLKLFEGYLDPSRNNLLTYSALDLLLSRYVIQTREHEILETPQELFLGIAMHLAMNEKKDRNLWGRRFYDMMSRLQVTVATPTLSNARKPFHQLSSCFIDTVPVSLDSIYRSIDNFAQVSKFGGGMGLYFGKVRAAGSSIRGFQGAAGGVIGVAVRALDNVIDLNFYPVPYARVTNRRYRALGLGVSGYHHALAKKGIPWESEEHIGFADALFERINYAAIAASNSLAAEKGSYEYFTGSDWASGAYFDKRGYTSEKWTLLRARVATEGLRNGYLLAVAPTSSTSIIAGTTAGIDPVMKRYFLEEKKGSTLPRVAPELSSRTFWLYKDAHHINQLWSLRAAGARQRHIDQAQSLNLYITTDFSLRQVLDLYIRAWERG